MKLPEGYKKLFLVPPGVLAVIAIAVNIHTCGNKVHEGHPLPQGSAIVHPSAGPSELALLSPLKQGGKLLDYDITEIHAVENGVIDLVLTKGTSIIDLTVALASDAGPLAPVTAGPYALFNSPRGQVPPEDIGKLTSALLAVVQANVGAPTPPGLGAYKIQPRPAPPPQ